MSPVEPILAAMLRAPCAPRDRGWVAAALHESRRHDLLLTQVYRECSGLATARRTGIETEIEMGEALLWAARATGDPRFHRAARDQFHWLRTWAPRTDDGVLVDPARDTQVRARTLAVVCPFLVANGHVDLALGQLDGHRSLLLRASGRYATACDAGTGTVVDDGDDGGLGSGWALVAMASVLPRLTSTSVREQWQRHAGEVVDAWLARYSDVVAARTEMAGEPAAAQLVAYALYRGAQDGWLPLGYFPAAEDLREATGDQMGTGVASLAFALRVEAAAQRLARERESTRTVSG